MNWLIAFTRDLMDIGLTTLAAAIVYEIWVKRYSPPYVVSIAINLFSWAAILNLALHIARALS